MYGNYCRQPTKLKFGCHIRCRGQQSFHIFVTALDLSKKSLLLIQLLNISDDPIPLSATFLKARHIVQIAEVPNYAAGTNGIGLVRGQKLPPLPPSTCPPLLPSPKKCRSTLRCCRREKTWEETVNLGLRGVMTAGRWRCMNFVTCSCPLTLTLAKNQTSSKRTSSSEVK